MGLVSNPLFGINQAALQAAQASDSALQQGAKTAGQSSEAPAENQFSNSKVGKDLQTLIKKSKEQQSQQGAPAGEFQGPSPQYLQMLSITHNFHAAKQTMAQQKLSEITRQAESGWLPDPKQMIKLIKQSGMKVDTSPEGIKMAVSYFNQYYGEKDPVTGDSREMPKEISAMIEKTKSGQLNQRDVAQFVMGGMVKNDLRSARYAGLSNQQKAQLEQRQFDAIDKATDLKAPATERAAALGVAAILNPQIAQMSKHMLEFAEASPEGRQNQIAIASGMASPAEQEQNAKAYSDQMFQAGVPKEAADKMGYYSSHIDPATGKHPEMPPELVAQLPRISPQTLQTTALAMNAQIGRASCRERVCQYV